MSSPSHPLFSIITVTYNAASTVVWTLQSVDIQTCRDYEHLIIDGASKDDTLTVIAGHDSPLRTVLSEPDHGIYDAMNKGLSVARGKYLIFLNAGDAFHTSETLERIATAIREHDYPGVVYGQTQLVNAGRVKVGERHLTAPERLDYHSFADGMVVCHQAFVALAKIAPLYDLRYKYSADYDWCIQCLQHSRNNVALPGVMIDYLDEGVTTANHRASLRERFRIMCYYYGTLPTVIKHLSFIPRYLSRKSKHMKQ